MFLALTRRQFVKALPLILGGSLAILKFASKTYAQSSGQSTTSNSEDSNSAEATRDYDAASYQATFDKHVAQGERPLKVSITNQDKRVCYEVTWGPSENVTWEARHNLLFDDFKHQHDNLLSLGYRPVNLCAYMVGKEARFGGLWEQTDGPDWIAHLSLTPSQFTLDDQQYKIQGYRLTDSGKYTQDTQPRVLALWYA